MSNQLHQIFPKLTLLIKQTVSSSVKNYIHGRMQLKNITFSGILWNLYDFIY